MQFGDAVSLFPRRSKVSPSWLNRRLRCCSPSGPSWQKRNCPMTSSQRAPCSVHTWRRKTRQRYVRLLVGEWRVFRLPEEVSEMPSEVHEQGSLRDENQNALLIKSGVQECCKHTRLVVSFCNLCKLTRTQGGTGGFSPNELPAV